MFRYKQITSERELSNSFSGGEILFKYDMPSSTQINLSKSFFRMRCKLSRADGTQLTTDDDIAANYLLAYNLFNQMYHCINGKQVGELRSYVAQCGALLHRQNTHNLTKINF